MYDLGDAVVLSVTTTDAAGAAANPTGIVLTVGLPDGTTVTPAVTTNPTGTHTAPFTTTLRGRHTVSWVATGANLSAYADVFNVDDATGMIVSLAEAKAHLNKSGARVTDDEELRGFILAATEWVERRVGVVARRSVTEVQRPGRDGFLYLNHPVISLTTLVAVYGSSGPTYSAATVTAQSPELADGKVWLGLSWWAAEPLLVTYTAGRAIVPALIRSATLDYLRWDWMSQRGSAPTPVDLADEMSLVPGTVPFKVDQKLESYVRPAIA